MSAAWSCDVFEHGSGVYVCVLRGPISRIGPVYGVVDEYGDLIAISWEMKIRLQHHFAHGREVL